MEEAKKSILFSLEKISQFLNMVEFLEEKKLVKTIFYKSQVYGYVDAKIAEEELKKVRKYIKEE